ncbi:hypothetical protein EGW08_012985, partial [Elysia chlorotica]
TRCSHEQGAEEYLLLRHVVVQQHADSHHGRRTRGDCRIQQEDVLVFYILGQADVTDLWLPCVHVCLNEDLPNADIFTNFTESLLHSLPRPQNRHSHNLPCIIIIITTGDPPLEEKKKNVAVYKSHVLLSLLRPETHRLKKKEKNVAVYKSHVLLSLLRPGTHRLGVAVYKSHVLLGVAVYKSHVLLSLLRPGTHRLQLVVHMQHYQVDGHVVLSPFGNDDVCRLHVRLNVVLKRRLHKLHVLLQNTLGVATSLGNVSPEPPRQTDVGVRVHKHFHVHHLGATTVGGGGLLMMCMLCVYGINCYHLLFPGVRGKVVYWHIDTLPFFESLQSGDNKVKVESVWVIKVILIGHGFFMLFLVQNLGK